MIFVRLASARVALMLMSAALAAFAGVSIRAQADSEPAGTASRMLEGTLLDGALWRIRVPSRWNGTLLLYSHGYAPTVRAPELAPRGLEEWLIAHGYALAASSYSQGGWAVTEAVPDQRSVLETFRKRVAKPARTIAWGDSMGGLITVALAESGATPLDGAVSACGSIAGTLAMMNTALDGAFAFVTLQAPTQGIRLVNVDDDRANAERVKRAVEAAQRTPDGRARLALAGVLGTLPTWSIAGSPKPLTTDPEAQLAQMAQAVAGSLFPPRTDQEQRAGGVLSWNQGIDYRRLLERTGRRAWVEYFYRQAHLNLDQDLRRLNEAPRVRAQAGAVQYMRAHYSPNAYPLVPLFSLHTIGDGLTSEAFQSAYQIQVAAERAAPRFRGAFVDAAGHCTFTPAEYVSALNTIELRVTTGQWSADPPDLNARAVHSGLGAGRFITHHAPSLPRACWATQSLCTGEPATP